MDNRPVAAFDSGVGGLSAVRVLRALLPGEDIIYLADTANVPYGLKEAGELRLLAGAAAEKLACLGAKALLVACGTASACCLGVMGERGKMPVQGVISPAAAEAAAMGARRIGVLSTEFTARSGAFEREILKLRPEAEVLAAGNRELVPLAEAGRVDMRDAGVRAALERALAPFAGWGCEALILGCTHFPLFEEAMRELLPGARLISCSAAGARDFARRLGEMGLASGRRSGGALRCLVSGDRAAFERAAAAFLPGEDTRAEKA